MIIAVAGGADGGGQLRVLREDATPNGPPVVVANLAAAVADREKAHAPRWLWSATASLYPRLLRHGRAGGALPRS